MNESDASAHLCVCGYPLRGSSGRCPECGRNVTSGESAPIAHYSERRFRMTRRFTLYAGKVVVDKNVLLGNRHIVSVPLLSLAAEPSSLWVRSPLLKPGLLLCLTGIGFLVVILLGKLNQDMGPVGLWVAAIAAGVGFIMLCLGFSRTEFAQFTLAAEGRIAVDVARSGPDSGQFDDFVTALRTAVRARHRQHPAPTFIYETSGVAVSGSFGEISLRPQTAPRPEIISAKDRAPEQQSQLPDKTG